MFYWEQLTRDANRAHSNNNFLDSIELNQQALTLVSMSHGFNKNITVIVEESMVNFLNIAESYIALGDYISANEQYENADAFIQSSLSTKGMKSDQWQLIMNIHNQLRNEWDKFKRSYKKAVIMQKNNPYLDSTHTYSKLDGTELHGSELNRSELNRSELNRSELNRSELNRSDAPLSKVINGYSSLHANH